MGRKENQLWQALSATENPPSFWTGNALLISVKIALPGRSPVSTGLLHRSRNGPSRGNGFMVASSELGLFFLKGAMTGNAATQGKFLSFCWWLYKTKRPPFLEFLSFRTFERADVLKEKVF